MSYWAGFAKRQIEWGPPLRPTPEDIAMFVSALHPGARNLLLGATQELLPLAAIAVDNDPAVVENYPKKAILADWRNLPFASEFDAVIGDGSLNCFGGAPDHFFAQVKKVLKPCAQLVLRIFISPEEKEPLDKVLRGSHSMSFHAFKWKVAHAMADPFVHVQDLYDIIRPVWDHPTLNGYKGSKAIYYFPRLTDLPKWDHIQFGKSYELCERCPVITWIF